DEASNRIAQGLKSLGVGPGDRVACLTKLTADCVALVLAANKIGAVCMPVNWRLAPPEVDYIVDNGQAKLMMADTAFPYSKIRTFVTEQYSSWYAQFEARDPGFQPALDDTALQLYSSGTAGLPKGVELTHRNLMVSMIESVSRAIGYHGAPDVMLHPLAPYHLARVGVALVHASHRRLSAVHAHFDPWKLLPPLAEHPITHAFL